MTSRLATTIGGLRLPNPVICGSGEPVMTEAGIRAALRAGAPHTSEAAPGAIAQETDPARLCELVARVRAATGGMQLWVMLTGLSTNVARQGGGIQLGFPPLLLPTLNSVGAEIGKPIAPQTASVGVSTR
jgi:hypothetical protein